MATSGYIRKTVEPNYVQLEWEVESQNVAENKTTISYWLYVQRNSSDFTEADSKSYSITINGKVVASGDIVLNGYGTKTVKRGTTTISHNANGSKTFSLSFTQELGNGYGTASTSGTGTLPTIDRASTLSITGSTLDIEQDLVVTRTNSGLTHTITYKCGTTSKTICTKSSDVELTFTPPLSDASQNTSGTKVVATYTIITYSGSTSVGSKTYTLSLNIPTTVKPSCAISVEDDTGLLATYGAYIQGQSKFKVEITPTIAYGSPITAYSSTANGSTYIVSSFVTEALKSSGTLTISSKVTDQRGRSGTASKTVKVLEWAIPCVTELKVHRCKEDGTEDINGSFAEVTFSAGVSSLNNQNTAKYVLEYKKSNEETYTRVELRDYNNILEVTDVSYIFAADDGSSYNVRLTVTDTFSSSISVITVSTGAVLMHWHASGKGMGIGKVAELEGVLDIGYLTRFYGGILHPILEPETDLNEVLTPNTYVGANVSHYNYKNCPLTSGTFALEVIGCGEVGQVKQKIVYCHKSICKTYERFYYQSEWGEWVCTSDFAGTLLYEGDYVMTADQTITLSEAVSKQLSGIVLVFACIDANGSYYNWQTFFVPKIAVSGNAYSTTGHTFMLSRSKFLIVGTKYLYIHDNEIVGNNDNSATGTNNGITYDNASFMLRYVIGV